MGMVEQVTHGNDATSTNAANPVPTVTGSVHPQAVVPGRGDFALTVVGANFVDGAVVNWNGSPRSTTFVSAREVQTKVLAADVTKPMAGYITNPAPGGGPSSSSYAIIEVHTPTKTIVPGPPRTYLGNDPMLFLTPAPDAVRASSLIVGDKFVISLIEGYCCSDS